MNGGISGFQNAPVTRTVVIASAILTVFTRVQSRSVSLGSSLKDIFGFHPLKSIASIFAFSSTPELMFGIYLLYYFRVLERQIGSNKYSVFSLFSMIVAMLFEILALTILKDPTLNSLVSGPYSLIFSSFVPFYFDIPVSTRICIFSVNFSDKSFIYLAGLQLLLSSWKRSLLPGLCGVFSGALYRLNIFGIRRMKFPDFFASSFSRLHWPTFGGSSVASDGNVNASIPYTNVHTEVNYPSFTLASSIRESFEDSVAKLVSMGFDRNSAIQALNQSGNDMNGATNILLEAQSH